MTERQQKLIADYLPHPRDPELEDNEYYVLDTAGKVRKVYVSGILLHGDYITYECREASTDRKIDSGYGSGFRKSHMYDNKQDCKNYTHMVYDSWEKLRELQKEQEKRQKVVEMAVQK